MSMDARTGQPVCRHLAVRGGSCSGYEKCSSASSGGCRQFNFTSGDDIYCSVGYTCTVPNAAVAFVPRAIIAIVQMIMYSVPTVEQLAESGRLLSVRAIFRQISPLVTVSARMFILKIVFINNFVE